MHSNRSSTVRDFWSTSQTVCTAYIRSENTLFGSLDFETRSSGLAATGMVDWSNTLNVGEANAVYYLNCTLASYDRLTSYRTDE